MSRLIRAVIPAVVAVAMIAATFAVGGIGSGTVGVAAQGNSQAAHTCPHGPGGVHGQCVSSAAHQLHMTTTGTTTTSTTTTTTTTITTTS